MRVSVMNWQTELRDVERAIQSVEECLTAAACAIHVAKD